MIVPGSANALLLSQGGYQIQNSLRFRASNNGYLSRTAGASPTNDKIFTWSGWVKLGRSATTNLDYGVLFTGYTGNSDSGYGALRIRNSELYLGGWSTSWKGSTALFRDPSAWYHIVMAIDTTQATASNRIKLYVNGSQLTAFGSFNNDPSQNSTMGFNNASAVQRIGLDAPASSSYNFDGYMANVYFIDGQALTPSSFGQTDAATGVWVPKAYSGTYGTNGFFLQFKDAASTTTIGYDTSGNANNFTTSGISVTAGTTFDQMLDTPTNNYPVWSPIDKGTVTVSEANMAAVSAADTHAIRATVGLPATGKWYWEIAVSALGYGTVLGIADNASNTTTGPSSAATRTYNFGSWFNSFNGGVVQYGTNQTITGAVNWTAASQPAANDIIMVAVDMDNGSMWVGKNGTWFNSSGTANPATNTDPRWTGLTGTTWFPYMAGYGSASPVTCRANFGQRAFSYTPPSGFKALNTANLSVPTIKKPSLYMDATLRTGTGATASVSSLGFQPDLVWTKSRSAATNNNLFDSVRGVQNGIVSNSTAIEYADANTLTSFNSNGYTYGSDASSRGVNINTNTYVDWVWKKGVTPGFDIVTWTADGTSPRNISHSLGAVPKFIITKQRSPNAENWFTYHSEMGATKNLRLDESVAAQTQIGAWNDTAPTSTQFTTGNFANFTTNGNTLVAYLFAEISGFSKFGSYVGNSSSDGPFVWCGFRPKWIFLKGQNIATSWRQYDAARMPNNEAKSPLLFNAANAESAEANGIDILSNGFKLRWSDNSINGSGSTYIFAAFAEAPFKYARAR
jgi:hypothetical protein